MKINLCRICKKNSLIKIFTLGNQALTGKFPKTKDEKILKVPLNIVVCKKCKTMQLDRNINPKLLFNNDYGYRSGINMTMKNHLKKLSNLIKKKYISKRGAILDIASNDGTFLNFFTDSYYRVGIDPTINKHKKRYKKKIIKIPELFNYKSLYKKTYGKKFDVITIIAMFYDIKNPNLFLDRIKKCLADDGIIIIEVADLYLTLKRNIFDTICHEHLIYYSFRSMLKLTLENNLKIIRHSYNNINGGTSRYFIVKKNNKKFNEQNFNYVIKNEKKMKLYDLITYKKFFKKIERIKDNIKKLLLKIKSQKKVIHGYGASTKGNVLMQFFQIDSKLLDLIADRNPFKNNLYTPGSKIKIVSESISRRKKPDYYFVLPWHFKKEILKREKRVRKNGTKFIFPLPNLKIFS